MKHESRDHDQSNFSKMVQHAEMELRPFGHQVGGKTRLLTTDDTTIYKPCLRREWLFYQTMPKILSRYTPTLTGLLDITIEHDASGNPVPWGRPIPLTSSPVNDVVSWGDMESDPVMCLRGKMTCYQRTYEEELENIGTIRQEAGKFTYMGFHNVLAGMRHPSILDLKVGLRLYGDDHSMDVRDWKIEKYNNTTSTVLGLRNSGMKVYNRLTNTYTTCNKYKCFHDNIEQFNTTLASFFHDGVHTRRDVIPPLIHKLRDLRDVISVQDGIRFYSVSLLIVYDAISQVDDQKQTNACTCGVAKHKLKTKPGETNGITKPGVSTNTRYTSTNNYDYPNRNISESECKSTTNSTDNVRSQHTENHDDSTVYATVCTDNYSTNKSDNSEHRDNIDSDNINRDNPNIPDNVVHVNNHSVDTNGTIICNAMRHNGDGTHGNDVTHRNGRDMKTDGAVVCNGDNIVSNDVITCNGDHISDDVKRYNEDNIRSEYVRCNGDNSKTDDVSCNPDIKTDDVSCNRDIKTDDVTCNGEHATNCDVHTAPPVVDIRLIDFAHATHQAFPGDTVKHTGPHRGFLFGLDHLINILHKLGEESV